MKIIYQVEISKFSKLIFFIWIKSKTIKWWRWNFIIFIIIHNVYLTIIHNVKLSISLFSFVITYFFILFKRIYILRIFISLNNKLLSFFKVSLLRVFWLPSYLIHELYIILILFNKFIPFRPLIFTDWTGLFDWFTISLMGRFIILNSNEVLFHYWLFD